MILLSKINYMFSVFLITVLSISACSGGDQDTSSQDNSSQDQTLEGFWSGFADNGKDIRVVITSEDKLYAIYTDETDSYLEGLILADVSVEGDQLSSVNGKDLDGEDVLDLSLSGFVATKKTLNLNFSYGNGESGSASATYDNDYESRPSLNIIEGTFEGVDDSEGESVTVTSGGEVSLEVKGLDCMASGTIESNASGNFYDVEITFSAGEDCEFPSETFKGIAVYDEKKLEVVVSDDEHENAGWFFGDLI